MSGVNMALHSYAYMTQVDAGVVGRCTTVERVTVTSSTSKSSRNAAVDAVRWAFF